MQLESVTNEWLELSWSTFSLKCFSLEVIFKSQKRLWRSHFMLRPLVVDVAKRPLLAVKCTMYTDLKVPYYTHFRSLFFPSSGLVGEPCTEGKKNQFY